MRSKATQALVDAMFDEFLEGFNAGRSKILATISLHEDGAVARREVELFPDGTWRWVS